MNDTDQWLRRIRLGQDSLLALKSVVLRGLAKVVEPHPNSLADELAAMANAAGGSIVLGVDDKTRQILGIPLDQLDAVEHWLGEICQHLITPRWMY